MKEALAELTAADTETRERGVRRLGVTKNPEAVAMLIGLLDDPQIEVASRAALALGQRAAPEALPALKERLRSHPEGELRAACSLALCDFDEACPVGPLVAALQDPDESVVLAVLSGLRSRHDPTLAGALFPLLSDTRWDVRYGVCQALVELGVRDPRLKEALQELLRHPKPKGRFQPLGWAEQALETQRRFEQGLEENAEEQSAAVVGRAERLLREGDADERLRAVRELQAFKSLTGTPSALEALVQALDDPESDIRATAAVTLGRQAVAEALPGLIHHLLHDEAPSVRRMCAVFLHYFPAAVAVDPLIGALGDTEWAIRPVACMGLGRLNDRRAIPALLPVLNDRGWHSRVYAAWALVRLQAVDPRLVQALEQLTREPYASEWDLQVDEMDQPDMPEEEEENATPSLKLHELLAAARKLQEAAPLSVEPGSE